MPKPTIDSIRGMLGAVASAQQVGAASAGKIKDAAAERLAAVRSRLEELRPRTVLDTAAADEYMTLTEEAGRLENILGISAG